MAKVPHHIDWYNGPGEIDGINRALSRMAANIDDDFTSLVRALTLLEAAGSSSIVDVATDVTGILPIVNGGTGGATAASARSHLGLAIGTDIEAWDADLDALAALASTGLITRTGAGTVAARSVAAGTGLAVTNGDGVAGNPTVALSTPVSVGNGGTGAGTAAAARTSLGVVIGTNVQAWDADLDALAALASSGLIARTGAGTVAARTLTAGANIGVTNGDGVSGNPIVAVTGIGSTLQAWDADLDALAALGTTGMVARTGAGTVAARTITAGAGISVSNGDGVSGNPTISATAVTKIVKAADENVTNSTTLQDDDEFQFTVAANTTYLVHAYLVMVATGTGPDWKFAWSLPSGSVLAWGPEWNNGVVNWNGTGIAGTPNTVITGTLLAGSLNGTQPFNFIAILSIGGSGGTAKFQWAQNSAGGVGVANTIKAGSVMLIH